MNYHFIAFCAVLEHFVLGRKGLTCLLDGIRTVNDADIPTPGIVMATISVATNGLQQMMCSRLQKKFNLSSHELLSNTAPIQVQRWTLLLGFGRH